MPGALRAERVSRPSSPAPVPRQAEEARARLGDGPGAVGLGAQAEDHGDVGVGRATISADPFFEKPTYC